MHPDTAFPAMIPDPRLAGSGAMRVSDLSRAERLVVCALRDGASRPGRGDLLVAEHEKDELRELRTVVDRYLQSHTPPRPGLDGNSTGSVLEVFEAHTLHALACLQAGLLGEAWRSLVPVWGPGEAGKALVRLQDVADALQLRNRRVERWHFDPAFFREAALI